MPGEGADADAQDPPLRLEARPHGGDAGGEPAPLPRLRRVRRGAGPGHRRIRPQAPEDEVTHHGFHGKSKCNQEVEFSGIENQVT